MLKINFFSHIKMKYFFTQVIKSCQYKMNNKKYTNFYIFTSSEQHKILIKISSHFQDQTPVTIRKLSTCQNTHNDYSLTPFRVPLVQKTAHILAVMAFGKP